MIYEVELYFGGEDPHMTLSAVEANCGTQLMALAYSMQRQQRAEHVSFGPPVERDSEGLPTYTAKRS